MSGTRFARGLVALLLMLSILSGISGPAGAQEDVTPTPGDESGIVSDSAENGIETPISDASVNPEATAEPTVEPGTDGEAAEAEATAEAAPGTPEAEPTVDTSEIGVVESQVSAQGTEKGTISVRAVDTNGDKVIGQVCFQEFVDAGGGAHGTPKSSICNTPAINPPGEVFGANRDPGNYVIAVTTTPTGYTAPADAVYSVTSNNETIVSLVFSISGTVQTGSIEITKVDAADTNSLLVGACFSVFTVKNGGPGDGLVVGVCDADDGSEDGVTLIEGVTAGEVFINEDQAPDLYEPGDPVTATVVTGETTEIQIENTFVGEPGSFDLTAEDENGDPVEGACFEVYESAGGGQFGDLQVGGVDLCSDAAGFVLSRNQTAGTFIVVNVVAPSGFGTPNDQEFSVISNQDTQVVVVLNEVEADTPGSIRIFKQDNTRKTLIGTCFQVFENDNGDRGEELTNEVCDNDDGNDDGQINIANVAPGEVLLAETVATEEFSLLSDVELTVNPGQRTTVTLLNQPRPEQSFFVLTAEDESGDPVEGACFEIYEDLNGQLGDLIVGGTDFCSDEDGFVVSRNQEPGEYIVVTIVTPDGFGTPEDFEFQVGEREEVLVPIVFEEVDANTPGRIQVKKVDNFQNSLEGACFKAFANVNGSRGAALTDEICDSDDGDADGKITVDDIPPGSVLLAETVAPEEFKIGPDVEVLVKPGQRTFVTVVNQPRPEVSFFVLTAEDEDGKPVKGACFEVYEDEGNGQLGDLIVGGTALCSDETGFALSRNQDPGDYVVVVVTTPDGFDRPVNKRFTVGEREEVPVIIVFSVPDPDDGDGNTDGEDDEDDDKDVEKLPTTGFGQGSNDLPLLAFGALGLLLLTAAAGSRRKRS